MIGEAVAPVSGGLLGRWQTLGLPDGAYTVRLVVADVSGGENAVAVPVTVDNTAPTVRWIFPQEGEILEAGRVRLVAEASDNVSLAEVDFYADETLVGSIAAPPFAVDWQATPGDHRLRVEAHDRAGSSMISLIEVTVR